MFEAVQPSSEEAPESSSRLIEYPTVRVEEPMHSVEPENYFLACVEAGKIYVLSRMNMFSNDQVLTDYALRGLKYAWQSD